jgi:cytochrome bd-type quinol oxidase subunit 2
LAYVLVTILAVALSVSIGIVGHFTETAEPMQNQAYLLSERFLPLLNLVVWGIFAWIYFRRRVAVDQISLRKEAISLGSFWLILAMVVDYVGFVLIKNPISLSPHDFYVGQFPWIYLIYVAIFFAPICSVALLRRNRLALSGA